jgi:hypothetical protein
MHYYGESDYWVAQYRSMTEGSAQQQAHAAENSRRGLLARGIALVTALFSRVTSRGVKKAGLDGRA